MPLINCPDCGVEVSDSAISCLNCARPIASQSKNVMKAAGSAVRVVGKILFYSIAAVATFLLFYLLGPSILRKLL